MFFTNKISLFKDYFKSSKLVCGPTYINKIYKIFFLNLSISLLELLGIGLLIPILNFFLDSQKSYITKIFEVSLGLNFSEVLLITALAFIIKNIIIFLSNQYQFKLIYKLSESISRKMFAKYINQDLNFFIKGDVSQALRNIFSECYHFSNGVLFSFIKICSELILLIFFFIFLLFINFKVTIFITFFLSILTLIFFISVQKKLKEIGEMRQHHESHRIKFIREGFESFLFLKIFQLSDFIIKKYDHHNTSSHNIFIKERVISSMPKLLFETALVILLCTIIYFLNSINYNKSIIFFDLAIITLVAFRLMPLFSSLLHYLQQLRFNLSVIKKLEILLNNRNIVKSNIINEEKFQNLQCKNINFGYDKNLVLKNININLNNNSIVLIQGLSGSGKTTLINILMGQLNPRSGEIFYNNKRISYPFLIKNLSYVPQKTFIFDDTIKSNIILDRDFDEKKFNDIIDICNLSEINKTINFFNQKIGTGETILSGGQKQRVSLARALYGNPEIIILDEPFSSLDSENFESIIKNLETIKNKLKCLFIIISHVKIPTDFSNSSYVVNNGFVIKQK